MTSGVIEWLARTSWQASVLILLVGAIQWLFRRQIPARWRYWIWMLVVLRLVMPAAPVSSLSIFNYIRPSNVNQLRTRLYDSLASDIKVVKAAEQPVHGSDLDSPMAGGERSVPTQNVEKAQLRSSLLLTIFGIWICGVLFFGFLVLRQDFLFAKRLKRTWMVTDSELLKLLEECRNKLNIGYPVPMLETREVDTPSLYGALHPRLLVPEGILKTFDTQELRHIFMHELAHVKRRDLAAQWLVTFIYVLHWFNPLVWLALRRMAIDRELACDALALSESRDQQERESYGHTLIKLLERFVNPAPILGSVGMLENGGAIKERITMIADFQHRKSWPVFGIPIFLILTVFGFTDGIKRPAEIANLVAWWPGDGNCKPAFGGNPGFSQGSIAFSRGKFAGAFDFHGSNEFVRVPSSPGLNFRGSLSISAWIQPRKDHLGAIVSKWGTDPDNYNNRSYALHTIPDLGLRFCISDLKNQWNPHLQYFETKFQVLTLNKWNHVVATYDRKEGCRRIYVDGLLVAERIDPPIDILESNVDVGIGGSPVTKDGKVVRSFFDGMIDDVRIYSRALPVEEVMALYNAGQGN